MTGEQSIPDVGDGRMRGLAIGMVSWGAPATLWKTLASYRSHGLLDLADDFTIYFNERTAIDTHIARHFSVNAIGSPENVGIGRALAALVARSGCDCFLFLENDWELVEDAVVAQARLSRALELLRGDRVDVVKLRHRHRHGEPLFHEHYKGREESAPHFLLDTVHWLDDPAARFPDRIRKEHLDGDDWFFASARFSNFTNNPCLYRTAFIRDRILPYAGGGGTDLERAMNAWWLDCDSIRVCQSSGLFMHSRIDRGHPGLAWLHTLSVALAKRFGIRSLRKPAVSRAVGGKWRADL